MANQQLYALAAGALCCAETAVCNAHYFGNIWTLSFN